MKEKDILICGHGSGTPSIKNLEEYAAYRHARKAPNGKRKGIVCVMRYKGMTDGQREAYKKAYDIIIGRNRYSQPRRAYVYTKYSNGLFYSDCSSSQMAAYIRIGISTGGLINTAGIYRSKYFEKVPVVIENGHIKNPEVLKVADQILFRGSDPSRPEQIGHVEGVYYVPDEEGLKYTGKFPTLPERGYFKNNDGYAVTSDRTEVKKVQKLVNWITDGNIKVDGKYGPATIKAVKKAQTILGVTADGEFGKVTLKAAKEYRKK